MVTLGQQRSSRASSRRRRNCDRMRMAPVKEGETGRAVSHPGPRERRQSNQYNKYILPNLTRKPVMHQQPVALVTGGSRGLGRGVCVSLARRGYAVAVNYAGNEDAARETQRELGDTAVSLLCRGDVAADADRRRMVPEVLTAFG